MSAISPDPPRRHFEKWGMLGAIASLLSVAIVIFYYGSQLARWTGNVETKVEHIQIGQKKFDDFCAQVPEKYIGRREYLEFQRALKDGLEALTGKVEEFGRKIDEHTRTTGGKK